MRVSDKPKREIQESLLCEIDEMIHLNFQLQFYIYGSREPLEVQGDYIVTNTT